MTDRMQGRWMRQQQRAAMQGASRSVQLPRSSLRDHAERVAEEREGYVAPIGRSPVPEPESVEFHGIRFIPDDRGDYSYVMQAEQTPRHDGFQDVLSIPSVMESIQVQMERAFRERIDREMIYGFDLGSRPGIAAGRIPPDSVAYEQSNALQSITSDDIRAMLRGVQRQETPGQPSRYDAYAMMYGMGGHRRSAQLRQLDVAERRVSSALGLTAEEASSVVARFREAMAVNSLGDIFGVLRELRGERDTAPEKKKEEPKYRVADVVSAVRRAVRMDD